MQLRKRRQDCELCGCPDAAVVTEEAVVTAEDGVVEWVQRRVDCDYWCTMTQHGTCGRRSGTPKDVSRGEQLAPPALI
jgi:hypothetical protein